MHRRRLNIQNFGSAWLKPPGVPKTLHQLREEKREQEEHAEALRREQMQQELAEAEAGDGPEDDGTMDDVQLDGAQDLDDMIPEAEDEFGMDDDDEDEDDEDDDDEAEEADDTGTHIDEEHLREERQTQLMAARVRSNNDAFREAAVRGDPDGDDMYGGAEELVEEDQGHMLDEHDFADLPPPGADGSLLADEDMGVDLDDDIPEAESGGYEHTDSDAGLSSDEEQSEEEPSDDDNEEDDEEIGFAPRAALLAPPRSPTLRGNNRTSASGPRASMDLSGLLSQDESSFMDSSPAAPGRWAQGRH